MMMRGRDFQWKGREEGPNVAVGGRLQRSSRVGNSCRAPLLAPASVPFRPFTSFALELLAAPI